MAITKPQSTKAEIIESFGTTDAFKIMHNLLLVGIWIEPEKRGSIFVPDKTRDESIYQGKVGLVLKKGPQAFKNDAARDFAGQDVAEGDWIVFRVSDGFPIDVNGVRCRLLEDQDVKAIVSEPDVIY